MKSVFAAAAALVLSSIGSAQITSIGPFTGAQSEGFEISHGSGETCMPSRVFNNTADLCTAGVGSNGCLTTGSWGYQCQMNAHGGGWFFGSTSTAAEYTFDVPAQRFGGYFGTNCGYPDATFTFYDAVGNVIASIVESIPADCQWHWLGWDAGTGAPIKRVTCASFLISGQGFIDMDDLEVEYIPTVQPPTPYCTSGTSSNGCLPSITANANPSVTFASSCNVTVSAIEGQKTAIVFYGLNQSGFTAHPWATGSNSFLCVKNPVQRTGVHNTNGTAGLCNGSLVFDWNAYQIAHPTALGNPFAAGQKVYVQGWYRDPPAAKTTNLSNAVVLTSIP